MVPSGGADPITRELKGLSTADFDDVGSKAANLGEMFHAGLPVPGGFVILTGAYRDFTSANGIDRRISELVEGISPGDTSGLDEASARIAELFANGEVPERVVESIEAAYARMDGAAVAVRSSSTAEDLPGTSFAGQYDTYLNISGSGALLENVKRCWASLWNARAISYRIEQGIAPDGEPIALAVVVQELVDSEKSGVLFTASPLSGRRDEAMINSSWGLGESVVRGEVTPDQFFVDKSTGRVKDIAIARKQVMTVRTPGGSESRPVDPDAREKRSLSDAEIGALCELAVRAEDHFGCPQDIEWAMAGGRPYLVQARPMTTLYPLPEPPDDASMGARLYVCFNRVFQGISDAITPLGLEMLRSLSAAGAWHFKGGEIDWYPRWYKTAGGRIYFDVTAAFAWPGMWKQTVRRFDATDGVAGQAVYEYLERDGDRFKRGRRLPRIHAALLRTELRMSAKMLFALLFGRMAKRHSMRRADRLIRDLERKSLAVSSDVERVELARRECLSIFNVMSSVSAVMGPGMVFSDIVRGRLEKWFGSPEMFEPVMQSLPDNPTTDMGESLIRIAAIYKRKGRTPEAADPEVRQFLERYGHRAMTEIDMGVERWSEDPAYVLNVITSYIEDADAKTEKLERNAREAREAVDTIVARVRESKGPLRAWVVARMLAQIRELTGQREAPKFHLVRALAVFRRMFERGGAELVDAGRLERSDDVFFLTFRDLERGGDLREAAREGRRSYEAYTRIKSVPRFMTDTGECIYAPTEKSDGEGIEGVSVSRGVYEGAARVIEDPRGAVLLRGEVLVAHSTDPSWTPLFLNAGALVMESGGTGSHGGIVAREYGIPAVSGIEGVTARIKTGQRVKVNGDTGVVTVLEGT